MVAPLLTGKRYTSIVQQTALYLALFAIAVALLAGCRPTPTPRISDPAPGATRTSHGGGPRLGFSVG